MIYTFYQMISKGTDLNYVGSTCDFEQRIQSHKSNCFNIKNEKKLKLYNFIRNNNITWDSIEFKVIAEIDTNIHHKLEQMYININNSKENGQNDRNAYTSEKEKKEYHKEYIGKFQREYRMGKKNKEYQRKYQREYQRTDKMKEWQKLYYETNKEFINKKTKCPYCELELSKSNLLRHHRRKHN